MPLHKKNISERIHVATRQLRMLKRQIDATVKKIEEANEKLELVEKYKKVIEFQLKNKIIHPVSQLSD